MKLTKLDNDRYLFNDDFIKVEGDWEFIFKQMRDIFEISRDEISTAVTWMQTANHNTAHFGLLGRVTHTSNAAFVAACMTQLEAVQEAQARFHECFKRKRDSRETHLAADSLKTLWVGLNIDGIKALLEDKYQLKSLKKTS